MDFCTRTTLWLATVAGYIQKLGRKAVHLGKNSH